MGAVLGARASPVLHFAEVGRADGFASTQERSRPDCSQNAGPERDSLMRPLNSLMGRFNSLLVV